ncbi:MAG: HEAT repeat domain-containing protein, partial [Desulfobacteraceae bacterium]
RLAKQIASSLNSKEIKGREEILEAYYKHDLIPINELPEAIQRRIKKKREIDKFLQRTDFYLKKFDEIQDARKYLRFAHSLKNIIPELIRQDRYEAIQKIIAEIDRHSNEKETLSEHARQILNEIEQSKILEALKAKFMTGQMEICSAIAPIFLRLGKRSLPLLLPLLQESDDQVVHKTACEILVDIDPSNISLILGELNREDFGTTSAVRMIRVLGDMGDGQGTEQLSERLKGFLKHENPRIREEALGAWYKLVDEKGEGVYLALLNDPEVGMQKEAIQCLGKIKSKAGLEKFFSILDALKDAPPDKKQQIAPTLFSALAFYGNVDGPHGGSLEDFLLETLEGQVSLGPLKFLKKKKSVLSEGAVSAICEALGKIGTIKSRPILQKLEKQDNLVWKNKAREALKTIVERVNVSQH